MRIRKYGDLISRRFHNVSLLGSLLVVMIHVGKGNVASPLGWWFMEMVAKGLTAVAVPFFFLASGFFLAGHVGDAGWYRTEVGKRVKSLVVPYFLWNVTWMAFRLGLLVLPNLLHRRSLFFNVDCAAMWREEVTSFGAYPLPWLFGWLGGDGWASAVGLNPFSHPMLIQFWYLRALFLLVVLSPLLVRLANKWGLFILFLMYGLVSPFAPMQMNSLDAFFRMTLSPEGVFYFTMGLFLRKNFATGCKTIGDGWFVVCGVIGVGLLTGWGICQRHGVTFEARYLKWMAIPFLMAALWRVIPAWKLPNWLAGSAFPIYLVHISVIYLLSLVHLEVGNCSTASGYCLRVAEVVLVSLAFSVAFRKFGGRVARWYLGGR